MRIIKVVTLVAVFLAFGQSSIAQSDAVKEAAEKYKNLLYYLEEVYVDSVDVAELTEIAIVKMLDELDPHSLYYSKKDLEAANEPLKGSFDGIGIQFNILKDTIIVVSPISGGPSEKLGIIAGDKIVEIDGENVGGIGIKNSDVMKKLKGKKGTKVRVGIKRGKSNKIIDFDITRDKIPLYSVDAVYMVDDHIGYIKVNRFAKETVKELDAGLDSLKKQGMTDLILDLQGNGGGYLNTAIKMADDFLSGDKLIVFTEGRAFPVDKRHARYEGKFEKGRMVVLIDQGSASASEIVTGAIQDWDRGVVVGRRSFGKGLVQRQVPLPDGSGVRMTVQHYYTPAGRCIQKSYAEGSEAYHMEKYKRYESGELFSMDSIKFPDSLKYKTMLMGRTVYGGGGITPDIFVPLDTTLNSTYFGNLVRSGVFNQFALSYVDRNRSKLSKEFPTEKEFLDNFKISDSIYSKFYAKAKQEEVEYNEEEANRSALAIELRLKALIGRNLFSSGTFYHVINELGSSYNRAVEILRDGEYEEVNIDHTSSK